jgi:hypothetical protein
MTGSPVKIGPFVNGLNTFSEPTAVTDTECTELTNFDIDLDGSIVSRPSAGLMPSTAGIGPIILGFYTTTSGISYVIITDNSNNIKAYDLTSGAAVFTIVTAVKCRCVAQYANKLWIVATPDSGANGGSWDPVGGYTSVAAIARGNSCIVYKERLFISSGPAATANPNRVNFSNAANFSTWTGTDFFDVAAGDGQYIVYLYSYQGFIVAFKNRSTYTFGYDSQPTKGQVQVVSSTIGLASDEAFCEFEGVMYVIFSNYLYAINNWNWTQVNVKVPFTYYNFKARTTNGDFSLSIVGNRIIARYFDTYYVYGIRTRAFSIWYYTKADYPVRKFWRFPVFDATTNQPIYISGGYDIADSRWFKMIDNPISTYAESFDLMLTTKVYDYGVPYTFKRLHWWGIDILSKTSVNFLVRPTNYNVPIKWSQLKGRKWSTLNTWARTIDVSINVTDSASSSNPSNTRQFIKLLKSLRFRQIAFRVTGTVDGTTTNSPLRIFSITAFTSSKQLVSRKIS